MHMRDLLSRYSLSEIALFVFLLLVSVKDILQFFDWFQNRIKQIYDKHHHRDEIEGTVVDLNESYENTLHKVNNSFNDINDKIKMLIESDKEDIKSFITSQHHHFVYEKGWIDDYSMECIEKRFAIYEQEHGNSFVKGLMLEIRALPKRPPDDIAHKDYSTSKYSGCKYIARSRRESRQLYFKGVQWLFLL